MAYRVSQSVFAELVERALAELPPDFARFVEEVPIEIRDHSSAEQRRRLGLGPGQLLLGLYEGRPRTRRSVQDSGVMPDVVYIFQHDIQQASNSEEELVMQVRKTVLHEIGHHFGLTEEDLDALGYG